MHVTTLFPILGWCAAMTLLSGLLYDRYGGDAIALIIALTMVAGTGLALWFRKPRAAMSAARGRVLLGIGAVLAALVAAGLGLAVTRGFREASLVLTTGAAVAFACLGAGSAAHQRTLITCYWLTVACTLAGVAVALGTWLPLVSGFFAALGARLARRYLPRDRKSK